LKTRIKVHIVPNSKKNSVSGRHGDAIKIKIAAPPIDGKANKALVAFLARKLSLTKGNIVIKSGSSSRIKTIVITGIDKKHVESTLLENSGE